MIVKPIKIEEIPLKQEGKGLILHKHGSILVKSVIEDFIKSSENSIEVIDDEGIWSNSNNLRKSFQNYLKRYCVTPITVTIRGDRVFLVKKEVNDEIMA